MKNNILSATLFLLVINNIFSCKKEEIKPEIPSPPVIIDKPNKDTTNSPINTDYFFTLEVTNIKSIEGVISIAIFDKKESFDSSENWYYANTYKVEGDKVTATFKNLPKNYYAVSVYHDKNSNGELDKNFLGIPQEGFAFSNNAMGSFGPPTFDQAKFYVDSTQNISMSIKLIHY